MHGVLQKCKALAFAYLMLAVQKSPFFFNFLNLIVHNILSGTDNSKNGINRMIHSTPTSPQDGLQGQELNSFEVIGSAESLVSRVLASRGLGKYCNSTFVAKELSEALDMTRDQMDIKAFHLLKESKLAQQQYTSAQTLPRRQNKHEDDKL